MANGGSAVRSSRDSQEPTKGKKTVTKATLGKKTTHNKPSLAEAFEKLLQANWFKGGKTLANLKDKLEEMAVIVPASHLPVHLLKACRGDHPRLTRNKEAVNGKKLWVYSQGK